MRTDVGEGGRVSRISFAPQISRIDPLENATTWETAKGGSYLWNFRGVSKDDDQGVISRNGLHSSWTLRKRNAHQDRQIGVDIGDIFVSDVQFFDETPKIRANSPRALIFHDDI